MLPSVTRLKAIAARVLLEHVLEAGVTFLNVLKSPLDADYLKAVELEGYLADTPLAGGRQSSCQCLGQSTSQDLAHARVSQPHILHLPRWGGLKSSGYWVFILFSSYRQRYHADTLQCLA